MVNGSSFYHPKDSKKKRTVKTYISYEDSFGNLTELEVNPSETKDMLNFMKEKNNGIREFGSNKKVKVYYKLKIVRK